MNQEIKHQWAAALRSGEYKKGSFYLRRSDGTYCCLGVLCDLYQKNVGGSWIETAVSILAFTADKSEYDSSFLPGKVRDWAGLDLNRIDEYKLSRMNDVGKTFAEIADEVDKL